MLRQAEWAQPPSAQNTDYVAGLDKVEWRKGYGEDQDAVQVTQAKQLSVNSPPKT